MVNSLKQPVERWGSDIPVHTPHSASKTLPLVRRIFADLRRLQESIDTQCLQLDGLGEIDEDATPESLMEEICDIREAIAADEKRFDECVEELTAIGAVPHQPIVDGVDFPAMIENRPALLCWHPGETRISHWHEIGCTGNQRRTLRT